MKFKSTQREKNCWLILHYWNMYLVFWNFWDSKSVVVEGTRGMTLFSCPGFPGLVLNSLLTTCQTLTCLISNSHLIKTSQRREQTWKETGKRIVQSIIHPYHTYIHNTIRMNLYRIPIFVSRGRLLNINGIRVWFNSIF